VVHELALTQSVVDLVAERTRGRRVLSVRVEVGLMSGVVPDAMLFAFDLATAGTPLEGAILDIEERAGRIRCHDCGAESASPDLLLLCPCGSADVEVVAGRELRVVSVELEREPTCA
jgi:hydrogenase nickel incorporation protein HypA/HybF